MIKQKKVKLLFRKYNFQIEIKINFEYGPDETKMGLKEKLEN